MARDRDQSDRDLFETAFGPFAAIHVRRKDIVAQAVSWAKAEQTGFWQQGDTARAGPVFDRGQIAHFAETIEAHNQDWSTWFDTHDLTPLVVHYEDVVDDSRGAISRIAGHAGIDLPHGWEPTSPHQKQADALNERWISRFRRANDRPGVREPTHRRSREGGPHGLW